MTIAQRRANTEVLIILDKFNVTNEVPENIIQNMRENQDTDWKFEYDDNLKLEDQKITSQSAILFVTLYFMYICKSEEEKQELKKTFEENEKNAIAHSDFEALMNKHHAEEVNEEEIKEKNTLPIEPSKNDGIFKKIINWLKHLSHKDK